MKMRAVLCSLACLALPAVALAQSPAIQDPAPDGAAIPDSEPCQLRARSPGHLAWRGPYGRGYEPFGERMHAEPLTVGIEQLGEACAYRLEILFEGEMRADMSRLPYVISASPSGPPILPSGLGRELTRGEISGNGAEDITVYVRMDSGAMVPAGDYRDILRFHLYEETPEGDILVQELQTEVVASVPAAIEAYIADGGSGSRETNLDFKRLQDGARRSSTMTVRSNDGVNITFTSMNRGRLRHDRSDAGVPYRLSVQNKTLNLGLSNGETLHLGAAGEPVNRDLALDFIIDGPVGGMPAGAYGDTVIATITPRG